MQQFNSKLYLSDLNDVKVKCCEKLQNSIGSLKIKNKHIFKKEKKINSPNLMLLHNLFIYYFT